MPPSCSPSGLHARSRCAKTGCSSSRTTTRTISSILRASWCGRKRNRLPALLLEVVHAPNPQDPRQLVERLHVLARQARVRQILSDQVVAVVPAHPLLQLSAERLVPKDSRFDRGALSVLQDDALAQAGGAAAVLHRFAQIEMVQGLHRTVRLDHALEK